MDSVPRGSTRRIYSGGTEVSKDSCPARYTLDLLHRRINNQEQNGGARPTGLAPRCASPAEFRKGRLLVDEVLNGIATLD